MLLLVLMLLDVCGRNDGRGRVLLLLLDMCGRNDGGGSMLLDMGSRHDGNRRNGPHLRNQARLRSASRHVGWRKALGVGPITGRRYWRTVNLEKQK